MFHFHLPCFLVYLSTPCPSPRTFPRSLSLTSPLSSSYFPLTPLIHLSFLYSHLLLSFSSWESSGYSHPPSGVTYLSSTSLLCAFASLKWYFPLLFSLPFSLLLPPLLSRLNFITTLSPLTPHPSFSRPSLSLDTLPVYSPSPLLFLTLASRSSASSSRRWVRRTATSSLPCLSLSPPPPSPSPSPSPLLSLSLSPPDPQLHPGSARFCVSLRHHSLTLSTSLSLSSFLFLSPSPSSSLSLSLPDPQLHPGSAGFGVHPLSLSLSLSSPLLPLPSLSLTLTCRS